MRCTKCELSSWAGRIRRPSLLGGVLTLVAVAVTSCAPAPLSVSASPSGFPTAPATTTSTSSTTSTPAPTVTTLPVGTRSPVGASSPATAGTAPGTRSTPRPTVPLPSPSATLLPPAPSGVLVDSTGHGETAFATITGGIVCAVTADGPQARCDVEHATYAKPPAPADCQGDWGGGVVVSPRGATLSCNTDTVLADAAAGGPGTWWQDLPAAATVSRPDGRREVALAGDASVVAGSGASRLTCRSTGSSVTCSVGAARFTVSPTAYSLR